MESDLRNANRYVSSTGEQPGKPLSAMLASCRVPPVWVLAALLGIWFPPDALSRVAEVAQVPVSLPPMREARMELLAFSLFMSRQLSKCINDDQSACITA